VNELQGFCVLYKHNRSYLFQEGCTMYDLLLTPAHMYPYVEGFWSLLHCPTVFFPVFGSLADLGYFVEFSQTTQNYIHKIS